MVRNLLLATLALTTGFAVVTPNAALSAQDVVLDEGRFALFIEGREVGSESFSIHRLGMGASARILATATVALEGSEMRPTLEARPDFVVTAYQNEVTGARAGELSVVLNGNRYVSRVSSADGEVQREYRAAPRTAVLENRVSHHYFFVARFIDSGTGPIVALSPLDGAQARLEVVTSEAEPFQLGGESVSARHVRLQGGGEMRELWIDDQGRVLRVEIPALGFRAERLPPG